MPHRNGSRLTSGGAAAVCLFVAIFVACSGDTDPTNPNLFDVIAVDVFISGGGNGTLRGAPAPIDDLICPGTCFRDFEDAGGGGVLFVTAEPDASSTFGGWQAPGCTAARPGACSVDCGVDDLDPSCTLSFDDDSGDVTFTLTARFDVASGSSFLSGTVGDTAASPVPIPGVWVSAALDEIAVKVDTTDAGGSFEFELDSGGAYAVVAVGTTGFMAFSGRDSVTLAAGATGTAAPTARSGAGLAFGDGVGDLVASPGATVSLPALDWQVWSREGCPGCSHWIVIGADDQPMAAFQVAVPGLYPGAAGQETLDVTAPSVAGSYAILVNRFSVSTEQEARDLYTSRHASLDRRTFEFLELGTLTVE